jgi:hypothetical protein
MVPPCPCRRHHPSSSLSAFGDHAVGGQQQGRHRGAFCSAERVTLTGSTMPMLEHVAVLVGERVEAVVAHLARRARCRTTTLPSAGVARRSCAPGAGDLAHDVDAELLIAVDLQEACRAPGWRAAARRRRRAGRLPRSLARVACSASSTSALRSFISVSVCAPTRTRRCRRQLGQALLELLAVVVAGGGARSRGGSGRSAP